MAKELVEVEEKPSVPGVGVAGLVMCPLFRSACLKQGCEMWVELSYGGKPVGRCALAWAPKLLIELRQSIDKLTASQKQETKGGKGKSEDVTKEEG